MTSAVIKPAIADDIPALQRVLDKTGLFPGDMLPDMMAPALAGDSTKSG